MKQFYTLLKLCVLTKLLKFSTYETLKLYFDKQC